MAQNLIVCQNNKACYTHYRSRQLINALNKKAPRIDALIVSLHNMIDGAPELFINLFMQDFQLSLNVIKSMIYIQRSLDILLQRIL